MGQNGQQRGAKGAKRFKPWAIGVQSRSGVLSRNEEGQGIEKGGQKSKVKSKVKVIEMIIQKPSVTIPEIAAALDMSIPGIEKIIRSLKEKKRLRRIGPDKGGYWEISG